jgi:hypothetical protein
MTNKVAIFSTLAAPVTLMFYAEREGNSKQQALTAHPTKKSITIQGGANVASSTSFGKKVHTPKGVCTFISREDYENLKGQVNFVGYVKNKFMSVDEGTKATVDNAVKNMEKADGSAQKTPEDFKNEVKDD